MVTQAATDRDRRMSDRLRLLRFLPVALAAVVFIWVVTRMVTPVRAVVYVADQTGAPVEGATLRMSSRRSAERVAQTGANGRATYWVARRNFNYTNELRVEVPEMGLVHFDQIYWRQIRRGEHKRITLTIGDTVTGTVRSAQNLAVLDAANIQATFRLPDGSIHTGASGSVPNHHRNATGGRVAVTRPGGPRAESVTVRIWAPGHAPATVTVGPARSVRGYTVFDLGDVRLEPWATVSGRALVQRNGTTQSWSALAKLIVWSPSAALLASLAKTDPRIEQAGDDAGTPFVVMRGEYSATYRLTCPIPAERVVLLAMAHDRPPAILEASPDALNTLAPGREMDGLREALLPAPNPITLPVKTADGRALVGAQVEFLRYIEDSGVAVAVGTQVYYTDTLGRVTLPILEDGVKYRVRVRRQGRTNSVEFDIVLDVRAAIVLPE